mmetsp:Transcript_47819/g.111624  ORF Transcript_47819/g.111624 Transcript_47819/m.111624 type:complete len:361 (+) Transcript_47819:104-1186(+)
MEKVAGEAGEPAATGPTGSLRARWWRRSSLQARGALGVRDALGWLVGDANLLELHQRGHLLARQHIALHTATRSRECSVARALDPLLFFEADRLVAQRLQLSHAPLQQACLRVIACGGRRGRALCELRLLRCATVGQPQAAALGVRGGRGGAALGERARLGARIGALHARILQDHMHASCAVARATAAWTPRTARPMTIRAAAAGGRPRRRRRLLQPSPSRGSCRRWPPRGRTRAAPPPRVLRRALQQLQLPGEPSHHEGLAHVVGHLLEEDRNGGRLVVLPRARRGHAGWAAPSAQSRSAQRQSAQLERTAPTHRKAELSLAGRFMPAAAIAAAEAGADQSSPRSSETLISTGDGEERG